MEDYEELIKLAEFARALGVSRRLARRWVFGGQVRGYVFDTGSARKLIRIPKTEIERFKADSAIEKPQA